MKQNLLDHIGTHFDDMHKPVKDEELLIFMDKSYRRKFDRKIFTEIKEEALATSQTDKLTPNLFGETYLKAYNELRIIEQQAKQEMTSLYEMRRKLSKNSDLMPFPTTSRMDMSQSGGAKISKIEDINPLLPNSDYLASGLPSGVYEEDNVYVMLEFDPVNLRKIDLDFLNVHSIEVIFGRQIFLYEG